jgi:hypothetical protein
MDNFDASLVTHDTLSIFTLARQHGSSCIDPRYVSRSSGSLVLVIAGQLIHYGAQSDQQIYSQSLEKQISLHILLRKNVINSLFLGCHTVWFWAMLQTFRRFMLPFI